MAKAAGEGASSPAPIPSSSKSVDDETLAAPVGKEQVSEQQPTLKQVVEEQQVEKAEQEQEVAAVVPMKQVQETLSVTTELGNRGEEPLYEPVSPTPLPDSPCDEAKPAAVVEEKAVDCSPFVEVIQLFNQYYLLKSPAPVDINVNLPQVINKKAGVVGVEEEHSSKSSKRTKKASSVLFSFQLKLPYLTFRCQLLRRRSS